MRVACNVSSVLAVVDLVGSLLFSQLGLLGESWLMRTSHMPIVLKGLRQGEMVYTATRPLVHKRLLVVKRPKD